VCSEETITEIMQRYLYFNKNAERYIWKRLGNSLEMEKTLDENGIADEANEFSNLSIEDGYYYPALHIYYQDDGKSQK